MQRDIIYNTRVPTRSLLLAHIAGYGIREIAAMYGMSPSGVYSRLRSRGVFPSRKQRPAKGRKMK